MMTIRKAPLSPDCGMTLIEVLVATVIVMVAVLSVATVYMFAGKRTTRAILEAEAARDAKAIRDFVCWYFTDGGGDLDAFPPEGETSDSEQFPSNERFVHAPSELVWKLVVELCEPDEGLNLYKATLYVALGPINEGLFDPHVIGVDEHDVDIFAFDDEVLGIYVFLIHKKEA